MASKIKAETFETSSSSNDHVSVFRNNSPMSAVNCFNYSVNDIMRRLVAVCCRHVARETGRVQGMVLVERERQVGRDEARGKVSVRSRGTHFREPRLLQENRSRLIETVAAPLFALPKC